MIPGNVLEDLDDASLIPRCIVRDQGAWEAFHARHDSFVRAEAKRQLFRCLGSAAPADVEDACQEVFCLLMKDGARTLGQFRGESSISTWLARVVRSVCRQLARHRRSGAPWPREIVRAPASEDDLAPDGLVEALARLPARDQRLLRLFFCEGKKYREIAREMGISINSIGPLLGRALRMRPGDAIITFWIQAGQAGGRLYVDNLEIARVRPAPPKPPVKGK